MMQWLTLPFAVWGDAFKAGGRVPPASDAHASTLPAAGDSLSDSAPSRHRYRAIFISDIPLYDFILWLNSHFNRARSRLGWGYWSLSQYLKHRVKNAVSFITDFERVLLREARRRGYDGVVCGHIHHPEIRTLDGMLYCNDGDWVESLSALVETCEGELKIIRWNTRLAPGTPVLRWNEAEPAEIIGAEAAPSR